LKRKLVIIAAIALIATVGVAIAATTMVTQHFPPIGRTILQVTNFCPNLDVSPDTPIPAAGTEGIIRLQCPGSASDVKCANWSGGTDCAFYAGASTGGVNGLATPHFTLPAGYLNIWFVGPDTNGLPQAQHCGMSDNDYHWLKDGVRHGIGNISGVYCAHLDATTDQIASFDITWGPD